ncbi:glutamate N-acetyltransferase/amino-acid N-acetyltransferase [Methanohalophilus levihalophilus]|uniref:bifunctional ornithine acetyltransferase/N-acetylglutamate synthase n=1 Tax=Methanohalophilus levihalophilus TaxID=1431282 RepID=UPI001AE3C3AB|nr:bifunctional ornithine acetyltransferase/N-acetylglutamate synthase [Methanohalophilus levihalophilus]MBP2030925.1 glutamate N-acetyltransferase/amino-acid N-acetyltransferase [Methanohalophilus levihalophilus]
MKVIDGGICAVKGVRATGIKDGKMGLAIIAAEGPAAGVFTRNRIMAAPVRLTRDIIYEKGQLSATIVNSGNANAFTGSKGQEDAMDMASLAADVLGVDEAHVAVASTGVIGRKMDMDWIKGHVQEVADNLTDKAEGSAATARSIMTTDTFPKEIAIELDSGIRIGGIAKGAGMIEPNMGTMLSFIYTDAVLDMRELRDALKLANSVSFNMVVVDGDTSTNDMVLLTATGKSSIEPRYEDFQEGLEYVMKELAKMIARDGEGASHFIEAHVNGATTEDDARLAVKSILRSPLVKTAIFGRDPNWGRIVAAAGYSGASMEEKYMSLSFSDGTTEVPLVVQGRVVDDENVLSSLEKIMESEDIIISVDLGMGFHSATAWGCDFTYDYIKINAEYTT